MQIDTSRLPPMLRKLLRFRYSPYRSYLHFRNRHPWLIVVYLPAIVLLIGLLAKGWWPDAGGTIDHSYYDLVAQVIPVFLLGYLVEQASQSAAVTRDLRDIRRNNAAKDRTDKQKREDEEALEQASRIVESMRALALSTGIAAAIGEGLAVYAVASGRSTTFLLAVSAAALAAIGYSLILRTRFT